MKTYFDVIAPQYDRVNSLATFGLWHRWTALLVNKIKKTISASSRILDVCTGTGEIPFRLCKELQKEALPLPHIDCLDFSYPMLEQAKIKLQYLPCCHLIQADATSIPKPAESYDIITISYGLRNLPLEKSLQELHRVMKSKSSLFVLDLTSPPFSFVRLLHSLYLKTVVSSVGLLCTHKKESYIYLRKSIQKFRVENVTQSLQEAGFTSIIVERFLFGTVSLIKAKKA